jgi:hypothetical protein
MAPACGPLSRARSECSAAESTQATTEAVPDCWPEPEAGDAAADEPGADAQPAAKQTAARGEMIRIFLGDEVSCPMTQGSGVRVRRIGGRPGRRERSRPAQPAAEQEHQCDIGIAERQDYKSAEARQPQKSLEPASPPIAAVKGSQAATIQSGACSARRRISG